MNKTFNSWFGDSEEAKRLYAQESLIVGTSEDFLTLMNDMGVTKSKLSKLIGRSKSFVTQSLNGTRNLTLRTLADMAYALDATVKVSFESNSKQSNEVSNDDDHFVDEDIKSMIYVKPTFDTNSGSNIVNVDFTSNNNHSYKEPMQEWRQIA